VQAGRVLTGHCTLAVLKGTRRHHRAAPRRLGEYSRGTLAVLKGTRRYHRAAPQARIRALEAELDALESDVHADEVLKDTDKGYSRGTRGVLEGTQGEILALRALDADRIGCAERNGTGSRSGARPCATQHRPGLTKGSGRKPGSTYIPVGTSGWVVRRVGCQKASSPYRLGRGSRWPEGCAPRCSSVHERTPSTDPSTAPAVPCEYSQCPQRARLRVPVTCCPPR
jgi:hypothetical protein